MPVFVAGVFYCRKTVPFVEFNIIKERMINLDIYDYAKYPLKEDWMEICKDKVDTIEKLSLDMKKRQFDILNFDESFYAVNLSYWLQEFNNRAFDLIANYTLLKSYFDSGIPDDEWYFSPGKNGQSIEYFPHFEEKHFGNLYWFGFYVDSYYTRFEGLIDSVYHLINIKYRFDIEPSMGFIGKVLKKLETDDKDLFDYLNALPNNSVYTKVKDFRNNIVHNFRPNQVDSGYNRTVNSNGSRTITMSVGDYTTSKGFLDNINDSLDLLADITDNIRNKVKE
jgi:hypothetical protein